MDILKPATSLLFAPENPVLFCFFLTWPCMREEWVAFSISHLSRTHRFPSTVWFQLLPAEPLKRAMDYIFNPVSWGRLVQSSTVLLARG